MDGHTIKKRTKPLTPRATPTRTVRGVVLEVVEGPARGARWQSDASSEEGARADADRDASDAPRPDGPEPQRCAIGSHPACDLRIADATVSRFHCEVVVGDTAAEGTRVRDLGSVNGVYLDGHRVLEAFLRSDVLLRLGQSVVRFQYAGAHVSIPLSDRTEFGAMVGRSTAMRAAFARLERVAERDLCVLLEGETGTGKSLAARSIHDESARPGGPFHQLNCGAIPATLIESALFGHVKGAFTGAVDRLGAFERAHGGTLFLDEVGELPLDLQTVLLTVLDEGRFHRVGDSAGREVDVRVIAASNRDLREEVNAGRFREDLYYRLAVLRVSIPPLRERLEDLPMLVERLLEVSRLRPSREQIEALTSEPFIARLQQNSWPGNIRELRNHLEQCLAFEQLPAAASGAPRASAARAADHASANDAADEPGARSHRIEVPIDLSYRVAKQYCDDAFKRIYVVALLEQHRWNVAEAAEAAGIRRESFHRLIRAAGIERPDD